MKTRRSGEWDAMPSAEAKEPNRPRHTILESLVLLAVSYCALSILTLPVMSQIWLGELPPLVLLQVPKIPIANWLRVHVVMGAMKPLGLSRGLFSPDYLFARPYALAIAYLATLVVFCGVVLPQFRNLQPKYRALFLASLLLAALDYFMTLEFTDTRLLSMY